MKVNTPLLIGASLMLVAAVLPLTNVSAHTCTSPTWTPGCPGDICPSLDDESHHHKNDLPAAECWSTGHGNPYLFCPHNFPHSHTYGSGGSAGGRSDAVTSGDEVGAGIVTVSETNAVDCDGDGVPGDYDGDWESGVGGGFFGHGPWRDEPTCNYGLTNHGSFVVVTDLASANIYFTIGADDTSGPVVTVDPVDGSTSCSTDGSITPGDPSTDPTADADDCLTVTYLNSGTNTCGGGGDGGYWVFLSGVFVDESTSGGVAVGSPPTAGTITA